MREVGTFEAKNSLSALLDLVERGEEVVITRHGRPVARLVREDGSAARRDDASRAAAEIRALAHSLKLGPFDWDVWKADRDDGRH